MDMIGVAANFYNGTIEIITYSTEIGVKFCFYRRVYQGFSVLGTENDVYIIFYERLSHGICIMPLRGWLWFFIQWALSIICISDIYGFNVAS